MEKRFFVPINKVDDEQRMVWGYASTPALDSQGDRITLAAMSAALPDYMRWANVREMHMPSAVGKAVSATVDDEGLYISAHVVDDVAWRKVKERIYQGFSVGGRVTQKVGDEIRALDLVEISLVDRPANPEAVFDVWKSGGAVATPVKPVPSDPAFARMVAAGFPAERWNDPGYRQYFERDLALAESRATAKAAGSSSRESDPVDDDGNAISYRDASVRDFNEWRARVHIETGTAPTAKYDEWVRSDRLVRKTFWAHFDAESERDTPEYRRARTIISTPRTKAARAPTPHETKLAAVTAEIETAAHSLMKTAGWKGSLSDATFKVLQEDRDLAKRRDALVVQRGEA